MRRATAIAPSSVPTSSSTTANSSPPSLDAVPAPGTQSRSTCAGGDEQGVAGVVSEPVVGLLEAVQVEVEQRDGGAGPAHAVATGRLAARTGWPAR
jgi:hypothetical protein